MARHELKSWPDFFRRVVTGEQTAQVRRNDRNYQKGDQLYLREYDPKLDWYSGHTVLLHVTDMLHDIEGLQPGFCVLSTLLKPDAHRYKREEVPSGEGQRQEGEGQQKAEGGVAAENAP